MTDEKPPEQMYTCGVCKERMPEAEWVMHVCQKDTNVCQEKSPEQMAGEWAEEFIKYDPLNTPDRPSSAPLTLAYLAGFQKCEATVAQPLRTQLADAEINYRECLKTLTAVSGGRDAEVKELTARVSSLTAALEELRDAVCTAVNWKAVIEAKVGDAPWISQGDANDVDLAVLKANEALKETQ